MRSLLLREPFDKLMSYTDRLTGPVMEAYLVGTHPIVIFPTDIEFCGNEWNERNKTLTIKYRSPVKKYAKISVINRNMPKEFKGLSEQRYDGRKEMFIGKFTADGKGEIILKF